MTCRFSLLRLLAPFAAILFFTLLSTTGCKDTGDSGSESVGGSAGEGLGSGGGADGGDPCLKEVTSDCVEPEPLVFQWQVKGNVALPLVLTGDFDVVIDWGDGTVVRADSKDALEHDYGKKKLLRSVSVFGAHRAKGVSFVSPWPITIHHFGGVFLSSQPGQFSDLDVVFDADDAPRLDRTKTLASVFSRSKVRGDLTEWDVSGIEDMSDIFAGADFSANVSTWDTSSVVNLSGAFAADCVKAQGYNLRGAWLPAYRCESHAFIADLSAWDTSRVKNLSRLLRGRTAVLEAGLGHWDTSNVDDMSAIFAGADAKLDLSAWDTSQVTNLAEAFSSLSLFVPYDTNRELDFNDLDIEDSDSISYPQLSLEVGCADWDLSKVEDMTRLFYGRRGVFRDSVAAWNTSSVVTLAEAFSETSVDLDVRAWDVSNVTDMHNLFKERGDCTYWDETDWWPYTWDCDTAGWPRISLDVSRWNTQSLTNLSGAFYGIRFDGDLSKWNTSELTDLSQAFMHADFRSDISGWDTAKVTTLSFAFADYLEDECCSLGTDSAPFDIDLSGWDLSSLTDLSGAFANRDAPIHPGVESWNVENVTDLSYFFYGADIDLDLSAWNTESVTDLTGAFAASWLHYSDGDDESDQAVGRLPIGIEHWDTSKVRSMKSTFELVSNIPDLSGWKTASVEDMSSMFYEGRVPTGLGAWDISSVKTLLDAFTDTSITTEKYDLLLLGWATTAPSRKLRLELNAYYSPAAASARASLLDKGWKIIDLGPAP